MFLFGAFILQAPAQTIQIKPQEPKSGASAADLVLLDTPPQPGVDSKELVSGKKEQLRLLESFLTREIKDLEKAQEALKSQLREGPPIASLLQDPTMIRLKDCSNDEGLKNDYTSYMDAVGKIHADAEAYDKSHHRLGPPAWMTSHASAQFITLGYGQYVLADPRHAASWKQFTNQFLNHCDREREAIAAASKVGPEPLVQFLANRARLTDLTLLLTTADKHLMWSNQEPF